MTTPPSRRFAWLWSWEQPKQAVAALFLGGTTGIALIAYFRWTPRDLPASVLVGVAGGLILALWGTQYIRDPTNPRRRAYGYVFDAIIAILGVAIVVGGIVARSAAVAVAGFPFIALAATLIALKKMTRH